MSEINSRSEDKLEFRLQFVLLSDATFGRGDGIAGLVNEEIEHDRFGLPFVRGRVVKGLLGEECANILYTLTEVYGDNDRQFKRWRNAAGRIFGEPGSDLHSEGRIRFSNAMLPADICAAVRHEIRYAEWEDQSETVSSERRNVLQLNRASIIEAMTAIRRQTMLNEEGVPVTGSLRSMRVLLRQTVFQSRLVYQAQPQAVSQNEQNDDLALLAAAIQGWRRGGTGRNRGRGRVQASLLDRNGNACTAAHFALFADALCPKRGEKSQ